MKMKIMALGATLLFAGCGTEDSQEVNLYKSKNSLGYYGAMVLFENLLVSGVWAQYEFENNSTTTLKADAAFKHKFDDAGIRYIQVPILGETWYPIGEYGVSADVSKILFPEGNNSTGYYQYFSQYDVNCFEIGQFKSMETNLTLTDTYVFCKEY